MDTSRERERTRDILVSLNSCSFDCLGVVGENKDRISLHGLLDFGRIALRQAQSAGISFDLALSLGGGRRVARGTNLRGLTGENEVGHELNLDSQKGTTGLGLLFQLKT